MTRLALTISRALTLVLLTSTARAQIYETDFTTPAGWMFDNAQSCNSNQTYGWAVDATPVTHPSGPVWSAPESLNFNDGLRAGPAFGGTA